MSKSPAKRAKPPPWIPPGKTTLRPKDSKKLQPKNQKSETDESPKRVMKIPYNENEKQKENEPQDSLSLSLCSSDTEYEEPNIHLCSIYQEMKLLYVHSDSLKISYLSTHRLMDIQGIDDDCIKEMLRETGDSMKELNTLINDLEFSVTFLENTTYEGTKNQEYLKVFKCKEKLLSKIMEIYKKLIFIFQTVFETQDYKEMSQLQDSLSKKLKLAEKKNISQEAVITDLERRISIYQSKTIAIESYKTNIEIAKAELEKQLSHKEAQIKYLSEELLDASSKQLKSDHNEMIDIIEGVKAKARSDKSALKKAIKLQRSQLKENEEKFKKLIQESEEKEKMMYDIASQRDQLKVHLTVVNNSVIELKNQIEEMKIQTEKLQNEMAEKDSSNKKEFNELQRTTEEKSELLEKSLKVQKKLKSTIEGLETELEASKKKIKNLKEELKNVKAVDLPKHQGSDIIYEEMQHLVSLLQSTKETFESLKISSHTISAGADYSTNDLQGNSVKEEILAAVNETKEHLLELKNLYKTFLQEQRGNHDRPKKNEMEKQLKKLENMYSASMKENQALKSEIEELKSASISSTTVQKTENYFTASMPGDNFTRKLQMELLKKSDEIAKMKYNFQLKERDLESQLKEYKDKVKTLEIDHGKIYSLEEELKTNKLQLSDLQRKKEEETERLLRRTRELQDSLDLKNSEYESLQRYVQLIRSSYFNVFEGS